MYMFDYNIIVFCNHSNRLFVFSSFILSFFFFFIINFVILPLMISIILSTFHHVLIFKITFLNSLCVKALRWLVRSVRMQKMNPGFIKNFTTWGEIMEITMIIFVALVNILCFLEDRSFTILFFFFFFNLFGCVKIRNERMSVSVHFLWNMNKLILFPDMLCH